MDTRDYGTEDHGYLGMWVMENVGILGTGECGDGGFWGTRVLGIVSTWKSGYWGTWVSVNVGIVGTGEHGY